MLVAAGLHDRGIRAGDVVSWQLPTWLEAAVLTLALVRLGAVQNPIVPILGRREVEFICRQAGTRLLVVPDVFRGTDFAETANSIAADIDALEVMIAPDELPVGDPAVLPPYSSPTEATWLFYTSGTTSRPKGARHTDATVIAGGAGYSHSVRLSAGDVLTMLLPLTHIGGITHILSALDTGCQSLYISAFEPEQTIPLLRERGATVLPGSPPFLHAFFDYQDAHPEIDSLFPAARVMTHGGSPKPPQLYHQAMERLGVGVISGYGMTEVPMAVWNTPDDDPDLAAVTEGRAVPGVELLIRDVSGDRAAVGQEGEVCIRGPQQMLGYVDSSLDAGVFDPEGFVRSGDLGRLDADARLTIVGRVKDIIIRNMENISAGELEDLLYDHPKVREVAVIGIPNELTGEHACAVIVPADPSSPPDLDEVCAFLLATGISKRKLPEQLEVVSELPRNAMEKVLKTELRKRFSDLTRTK